MSILTIRYQFSRDDGSVINSFEGLNQEADSALADALEDGYRVILQEVVPPPNGLHNYLVIVKLWKSDRELAQEAARSDIHRLLVDPGVGESQTVKYRGDGEPVDHAPSLSHTWTVGNAAEDTPQPRVTRKTTSAKTKRAPRKSK